MSKSARRYNPKKDNKQLDLDVTQPQKERLGYLSFIPNQSQKGLVESIRNNTLVFVEGPAGTGKTATVLFEFVRQYMTDKTKKIVVVRTPVEAGGDKIGFLTGDYNDKVGPHFNSAKMLLEQMLSPGKVKCDLGERIHFMVPNYALGATLDNSLVLIDEAQQLQPNILKLLLERLGKNTTCVVVGDPSQLYVNDKNRNALTDAIPRFFHQRNGIYYSRYEDIDYYRFDVNDVMRSDIVKTIIRAYGDLQR